MDHRKFKENLHAVVETEQTWIKDLIGYLHDQLVESFCILSNEMEDSFVFTWSNSNSIFGQVWKLDRTVTKDELNQGIILAGYGNFGSNFSSYLHFLRLTLLLFGDL